MNKKFTQLILLKLTLVQLLFSTQSISCEFGFTEKRNENLQHAECMPCPENCSVCFYSPKLQTLGCSYCKSGFFLDGKTCLPCIKNCVSCAGPALEDCRYMDSGFHYNFATSQIESCADSACSNCDQQERCSSCLKGHYLLTSNSTSVGAPEDSYGKCLPCSIDHCEYCVREPDQVKNGDFVRCTFCESGYVVVSGQCQKCDEGCQYCEEETKTCIACITGFVLDQSQGKCSKPISEGCALMRNGTICEYCSSGYFLNSTAGVCNSCSQIDSRCSYCYLEDGLIPKCGTCDSGFYKSEEGDCKSCGDFCNYCSKDRCFGCEHGYYYDTGASSCQECKKNNCGLCGATGNCQYCDEGYYLDDSTQSCFKCEEHCLGCYNGADNCSTCPINYLSFEEQIVTIKNGGGLLMKALETTGAFALSKNDIKLQTKCVKECPKEVNGRIIISNFLEKTCQ